MNISLNFRHLLLLLFFSFSTGSYAQSRFISDFFTWKRLPDLLPVGNQSGALGVAGAFSGVHNDVLIMAGGSNFKDPKWDSQKSWFSDILIYDKAEGKWQKTGELPFGLGYGSSVSTEDGVVCLGGTNGHQTLDEVFILSWEPQKKKISIDKLASLPQALAFGSAVLFEDYIYVAGGQGGMELSSAMKNFWRIKLVDLMAGKSLWEILPPWDGPPRAFNLTVAQSNGINDCIYVLSGRCEINGRMQALSDGYLFNPKTYRNTSIGDAWQPIEKLPSSVMAGTSVPIGQNHIFVFGGADGSLFYKAEDLKESHPGFPKRSYGYNTITNTWFDAGATPANQVTTQALIWDGQIVIPSGEVRPRTRTPAVWILSPVQKSKPFGWINSISLFLYLVVMIGVGIFFSFRNKSTEDFFRGGQRIPWWAAGLSIFATMLSSLTFIAIPAKAYATDWVQSFVNLGILLVAPFVVWYALPFFRKINVTSAYEFLEKRFSMIVRLLASSLFVFFQIGRMAIVMYLPSLALATITSLSVETCILIIGGLSILYCTMGGLEAVIWTDAIQAIILLGGALLSFIIIISNFDGGMADFFSIASENQKFHAVNWDWDVLSITRSAFWVVLLGGIGQALIPGTSDQAVIQRYMSVDSESKARKAIWTNAIITVPATILFFAVGTALFVFYKSNPTHLDPNFPIDAVFPLFIANELPIGIAGLVVAGIFAAAQSTISTSMNSTSTAIVTDFIKRFKLMKNDKSYLNVARILTVTLGILGTSFALVMANANIISLWDTFMKVIGLFGGPLCGVFLLGMLSKQANTPGVILGLILGVVSVAFIQIVTGVNYMLHAGVGIISCLVFGYLASSLFSLVMKDYPAQESPKKLV